MASQSWWTYILECRDKSFYVGSTGDLEARVRAHSEKRGAAYTSARLPIRLIYSEPHSTLEAAVRRERQLKGWTRAKKVALINANHEQLHALSRSRRRRESQPSSP